MDLMEEKPISVPEVNEILKRKEKEYADSGLELGYEQKKALEHAMKFSKISVKDAKELAGKLGSLELGLTQDRVVKITELMPGTTDDVRAIFAKERFKYTEEDIKKVIDLVDQYR
ncbi:MAG: RNA polymerase Rpb4 family protein [Candidatus Altiarchaeota archaeon]|nr:RNA polymerase Rpb4 family protein [Candidatus Altiarchaeota archaeon]